MRGYSGGGGGGPSRRTGRGGTRGAVGAGQGDGTAVLGLGRSGLDGVLDEVDDERADGLVLGSGCTDARWPVQIGGPMGSSAARCMARLSYARHAVPSSRVQVATGPWSGSRRSSGDAAISPAIAVDSDAMSAMIG